MLAAALGRISQGERERLGLSERDGCFLPDSARRFGACWLAGEADLSAEGWEKRGEDALSGCDQPFLLWDPGRRRLYAVRDAFGARPLYYHAGPQRLVVCEHPEPLLALEGIDRRPEDAVVLDYLAGDLREPQKTFLRGLLRVPAGHHLVATPDSVRATRHFHPPAEPLREADRRACLEEFRRLFRRAVERRLVAPTLVHVSGGIDSSAVACVAAELRPRDVVCISGRYFGLPCDEGRYIDAVVRRLPVPHEHWDGTATVSLDEVEPDTLVHPVRELQSGDFLGEAALVRRHGASVVLSGLGGDELLFERGVFRDLAARGRLLALLREARLAPAYSTVSARSHLLDATRGAIPAVLRRAVRTLVPAASPPPPPWLGPRLRERWPQRSLPLPEDEGLSHTQRWTWAWLTSPREAWMLELEQHRAARHGFQYRWPFFDVELARFVLSIPWHARLPGGRMKALVRDALADVLPPEIAERRGVTTFESAIEHHLRPLLPELRAVLTLGPWHSEPYVDRRAAQALLERDARTAFSIAMLERWLRALEAAPNSSYSGRGA